MIISPERTDPIVDFKNYFFAVIAFWLGLQAIVRYLEANNSSKRRDDIIAARRESLQLRYSNSKFSYALETISAVVALASWGLFVYLVDQFLRYPTWAGSEHPDDFFISKDTNVFKKDWVTTVEFIISVFFVFDFGVHFAITKNKSDWLLTIPAFVYLGNCSAGLMAPFIEFYFYGYEFLRIVRVYSTVEWMRSNLDAQSAVANVIASVGVWKLTFLSMLLCTAGAIFVAENGSVNLTQQRGSNQCLLYPP